MEGEAELRDGMYSLIDAVFIPEGEPEVNNKKHPGKCAACGRPFDPNYFYHDNKGPGGWHQRCIKCKTNGKRINRIRAPRTRPKRKVGVEMGLNNNTKDMPVRVEIETPQGVEKRKRCSNPDCIHKGRYLTLDWFHFDADSPDKCQSWCKDCNRRPKEERVQPRRQRKVKPLYTDKPLQRAMLLFKNARENFDEIEALMEQLLDGPPANAK